MCMNGSAPCNLCIEREESLREGGDFLTPLLMVGTDAERKRLDGRRMKREEEERGGEATEGKKICEGSLSLGGALPEHFRCCALESPAAEEKQGGKHSCSCFPPAKLTPPTASKEKYENYREKKKAAKGVHAAYKRERNRKTSRNLGLLRFFGLGREKWETRKELLSTNLGFGGV